MQVKTPLVKIFFTKLKEKTPKDLESNVVYEIPCSECNGVYIGTTGRYFKKRLSEHIADCKNFHAKRIQHS